MARERMHNFGANLSYGLPCRMQHFATSYSRLNNDYFDTFLNGRFYSSCGPVRYIPKAARLSKPLTVINNSEAKRSNSFTSNPLDEGQRKAAGSLSHKGLQFLNLSEQTKQSKSFSGPVRYIPKAARLSKPLTVINNSETKSSNSFTSNPLEEGQRKATGSLSHKGLQFLNLTEQTKQSKSLQCDDVNSGPVRYISRAARQTESFTVISRSETENCTSIILSLSAHGPRKATDSPSPRGLQSLNLSGRTEQSKSLQCDDANSGITASCRCTSELKESNIDSNVDYEMVGELLETAAEDESAEIENPGQIKRSRIDAENFAIQLLGRRAISASELRKKLQTKNIPCDIIEDVVNDFCYRGLVNDNLYAENYSRSRWLSSTWGPGRIKKGLVTKGVSRGDAEKAITMLFEGKNGGVEEPLELGYSKDSMDRLIFRATKRYVQCQGLAAETRRSRMVQWLVYRGFKWDVVTYVMKHLEGMSRNT